MAISPLRPDSEQKVRRLRRDFQRVTRRIERKGRFRRHIRRAKYYYALGVIVASAVTWELYNSPWPVWPTLKHVAAAPNCAAARAVGLAPAIRGQPGYWSQHDRDDDGIACEPFPR